MFVSNLKLCSITESYSPQDVVSALNIFNPKKMPSIDSSDCEHYDKGSLGTLIEQLEQLYVDGEAFRDEYNMLNNLPTYVLFYPSVWADQRNCLGVYGS